MGSAAPAAKAALFALCGQLFGDCQVTYGHPGPFQRDDIISVGDIRSAAEPVTMDATRRPREETFTIDVIISCYRGGGPDVQQAVTERAYALAALLENALQTTAATLTGTVRLARVSAIDSAESWDQQVIAKGRVTELTATVACQARI